MEPPVSGAFVFVKAFGTHLEPLHAGAGAVIGKGFDDGKTGPAMGAIDKGISVTAVGVIEKFPQARGAGGQVGKNPGFLAALLSAFKNLKMAVALGFSFDDIQVVDHRAGGDVFDQGLLKSFQVLGVSFHFQFGALG
jgi:hypothetical protein